MRAAHLVAAEKYQQELLSQTEQLRSANLQLRRQTELRLQAERSLHYSDRLEALGRLTAALGHEINNPLCYVAANLAFIDEQLETLGQHRGEATVAELREVLADVIEGTDRIERIVRNIRLLSDQQRESIRPVQLAPTVAQAIGQVTPGLGKIRVHTELAHLPMVWGDQERLQHVVVNMISYALQNLRGAATAEPSVQVRARLCDGQRIKLRVYGDPEETAPPTGAWWVAPHVSGGGATEGTALGLSICQGIVAAFGCRLEME